MNSENIEFLTDKLNLIKSDDSIPRNIRVRIDQTINCLNNNNKDLFLKIDEALQELDEISNDPNLPNYIRVEILNLIGLIGGYQ